MNNIRVSIIIPIFNSENYLRKCLDSAVNQTLDDIEIICVDNNSTDNSLNLCLEYKLQYPTKIIITEESIAGPNNARQKGLDMAKGDYIMFLDSDDWLEPNACEICYNLATKNNYDLIEFSLRSIFKDGDKLIEKNDGIIIFNFFDTNPLDPSYFNNHKGILANLFISRNLFVENKIKLIKLPLFEDTFSAYLLLYYCKKFVAIPQIFYNYLQRNDSNISKAFTKQGSDLLLMANKAFLDELRNRNLLNQHQEFLLQFLFANMLISDYWLIGFNSFNEKKEYINKVIELIKNSINVQELKVTTNRGMLIKLFILISIQFNNNLNTLFFIILRRIYKIIFG